MAYSHQKQNVMLLGTGGYLMKTSGTGMVARYTSAHSYILHSVMVTLNASAGSASKPKFAIRKVSNGGTTTATGTAITGGGLSFPVIAKGKPVRRAVTPTLFKQGDQLVVQVVTAASGANSGRITLEVSPTWEYVTNATGVTTVTA